MRTALIPAGTGPRPVASVIIAGDRYEPPDDYLAVPSDTANPGDLYDGKAFTPPAPPDLTAAELAVYKDRLCAQVDQTAEFLRNRLITPGSGQALEYQESYAQAKAALSQDEAHAADATKAAAAASDYPMLEATVGYDVDPTTGKPATDVLGVARAVKRAYEGYLAAGAAIKAARIEGKAMVNAAGARADADAALAAIKWPALG